MFGLAAAVALQNLWVPTLRAMGLRAVPRPAVWGNPRGFSVDILIAAMLFVGATIYVLTYIPYFALGHGLGDLLGMQKGMFTYHYDLHATHPYSSKWWQWPLLQVPISYYYKDFRTGAAATNGAACCVAEILALPNPAVWWLGLVSVPFVAWLAYRERIKAYALLIVWSYLLQWLPWIASPRIASSNTISIRTSLIICDRRRDLAAARVESGELADEDGSRIPLAAASRSGAFLGGRASRWRRSSSGIRCWPGRTFHTTAGTRECGPG